MLIQKNIDSSYLNFLLGRSYFYEKKKDIAVEHLKKALQMDIDNIEAEKLIMKIAAE